MTNITVEAKVETLEMEDGVKFSVWAMIRKDGDCVKAVHGEYYKLRFLAEQEANSLAKNTAQIIEAVGTPVTLKKLEVE